MMGSLVLSKSLRSHLFLSPFPGRALLQADLKHRAEALSSLWRCGRWRQRGSRCSRPLRPRLLRNLAQPLPTRYKDEF